MLTENSAGKELPAIGSELYTLIYEFSCIRCLSWENSERHMEYKEKDSKE